MESLGYSNQFMYLQTSMSRYFARDHIANIGKMVLIQSPRDSGERKENMKGQIELLEYLDFLEKKGFDILDYIPTGHENAVTREELCRRTGLYDRVIRSLIHEARLKIGILNMQDGRGYFIPDMNLENDRILLKRHVIQEESRAKNILDPLDVEKRMLMNCGIDWSV